MNSGETGRASASHVHLGREDRMALWEVLDKEKEKCAEATRGDSNFLCVWKRTHF